MITWERTEGGFYTFTGWILSNDPEAGAYQPSPPESVPCEYCGAARYFKGQVQRYRDDVVWNERPEPCTCAEASAIREREEAGKQKKEEYAKHREQIAKILGDSFISGRLINKTFDTFQITTDNKAAVQVAKQYADTFDGMLPSTGRPEPGRNGLLIAGTVGTGKTHLAAAIANQLISQGTPVICMTMIDLLERIKRTFSGNGDESSVLTLYKTAPLLIIDDIGKEPPTEWAVSTIYNIINGRYVELLPIIITTNYDAEAMIERMTPRESRDTIYGQAIVDRLMEMCRSVVMTGESWRQR